jgi:hypothetical protein
VRLIGAALILLVVVVIVVAVGYALSALAQRRLQAGRPWKVEETSDGELVSISAVKPGSQPLLLGAVPIAADDFDSRLYLVRAEARERVRTLNDRT